MDYNPRLIEWCQRHLPFAQFRVNQLEPPLPCEAEYFDFIYARSIFTHMTEELQEAWLQELRRVLKPNGTLLFTVSGGMYSHLLLPDELEQYQDGRLVVRDAMLAGENACASFHPPAYVDYLWPQHGFEISDFLPGGQVHYALQDTYLARKRSSVANGT